MWCPILEMPLGELSHSLPRVPTLGALFPKASCKMSGIGTFKEQSRACKWMANLSFRNGAPSFLLPETALAAAAVKWDAPTSQSKAPAENALQRDVLLITSSAWFDVYTPNSTVLLWRLSHISYRLQSKCVINMYFNTGFAKAENISRK